MSDELTERLTKARIALALDHPFLATAVMRLPFKESAGRSWCPTMATDGYHIFFNPEWVDTLPGAEIEGVIAHEVLHVVFGHADRVQTRRPDVWNIACDHAINLLLLTQGLALPAGGAMDMAYAGMTAEEIYDHILSLARRSMPTSGLGPDLLSPGDIRLRDLQDTDALDMEQRRQLRQALGAEMQSQLHGTGAGFFAAEISVATTNLIDWQALLRRWLYERVQSDWRSFPFSKKHLARGFFMPSLGLEAPGHVVFAIDTSGSMSNADLALIAGEIHNYRETFPSKLTVLQCDAAIQSEQHYDAHDPTPLPETISLKGRGGTDFRPVFEWASAQSDSSYPILVYATDGFGTFPKDAATFPTIWVLTAHSAPEKSIPFGVSVRLPAGGKQKLT